MIGRLLCALGLHRVVTTREGKELRGSTARGSTRTSSAAHFIHCHCYRPGCKFHVIIDTHSGEKMLHISGDGANAG